MFLIVDMARFRFLPLSCSIALSLAGLSTLRAQDSVTASDAYLGSPQKFDNQTTTGSPLVFSRSGSLGSASVSSSLGLVQVDVSSAANAGASVYTSATGKWFEDYTISLSPGFQATTGTADFTFELAGTISAGGLGVGNKVDYTVSIPNGNVVQEGWYDKDGSYLQGTPGRTFTLSIPFTYGQPINVSAYLSAFADPGSGQNAFGNVHMSLRQTGFTVTGGNFTSTSSTGAGAGATFAPGAAYDNFTLSNTIGHQSTVTLLDGNASVSRSAALNFVTPDGSLPSVSDTVSLSGTAGDLVVIQLQYDEAAVLANFGSEAGLYLAWFDSATSAWENAIAGNSTNASNRIERAYNPLTDFTLGNWGEDPVNNTVWAVIDHNSEFTVASLNPTPEPGSALLLGLGGVLAGCRRRRSSGR